MRGQARRAGTRLHEGLRGRSRRSRLSLPDFARNAHGNLAEQNRLVGAQRGIDTTPARRKAAAMLRPRRRRTAPGRGGSAAAIALDAEARLHGLPRHRPTRSSARLSGHCQEATPASRRVTIWRQDQVRRLRACGAPSRCRRRPWTTPMRRRLRNGWRQVPDNSRAQGYRPCAGIASIH